MEKEAASWKTKKSITPLTRRPETISNKMKKEAGSWKTQKINQSLNPTALIYR